MTESDRQPHRIAPLDGLRGCAVLMVIWYHTNLIRIQPDFSVPTKILASLPQLMWSGVDLFFVLSGFLITWVLCNSRGDTNFFRNFYMRRVLRLAPAYYLVLGVATALQFLFGIPHLVPSTSIDLLLYYLNFSNVSVYLAQRWTNRMVIGWSLSIEEQFYAVWSLAVNRLKDAHLATIAAVLLLACPILRFVAQLSGIPAVSTYVGTCFHLDGLAWGALISLAWQSGKHAKALKRFALLGTPAALVVLIFLHLQLSPGQPFTSASLGSDISAASALYAAFLCAILFATNESILYRTFSSSTLRLVGKHSYAMYLTHQLIIYGIQSSKMLSVIGSDGTWASLLRLQFVYTTTAMLATFACSWVIWHLVEKHFLALKSKFGAPSAVAVPVSAQ